VNWLILCEGLLFTAYGAHTAHTITWLALGFALFGIVVAARTGVGVFTALDASQQIRQEFERCGLPDLCSLAPPSHIAERARWAAEALPFVFGAMWVLAMTSALLRVG
jgi:hypothetical protein